MPKFSDLQFTEKDKVPVDFTKLKERAPRSEPPQPGHGYVFQFPKISLDDDNWDEIETEAGRRVSYAFRNGKELILVTSPLNPAEQGGLHGWQVSNEERTFAEGEDPFSKMAFLLKAFGIQLAIGASVIDYAKALTTLSGRRVQVSLTWTASCSPKRDIYRVDPETGVGEVMEGVKGCGQRYGMKAKKNKKTGEETIPFPKDDEGKLAVRFQCIEPCEASISPFIDLYNFRAVEVEAPAAEGGEKK